MIIKTIRVHQQDSAFVYAISESLEGSLSCTTLASQKGEAYRDIELCIVSQELNDVQKVLEGMRKKFPILELN
jgi:hypothetical protein